MARDPAGGNRLVFCSCRFRRCREVDYPTIQVVTFYPGASPDVMATTVTAPLERQFGQMQGLNQMTSTSSGGVSVIVLQFSLTLGLDVAEQEVQSSINCGADVSAVGSAHAAGIQQDESRGCAGVDAGGFIDVTAAVAGRGSGGYPAGSAHLAVGRSRPGEHQRRTEAGGAHPGESDQAVGARAQPGGCAHGADVRPA